ncbi:hypothetical protein ABIB99_001910 [Bradyrhizobium sp. LA6.1]
MRLARLVLALTLIAGATPAFAQAPGPVPALPDAERRTSYSISGTTCTCNVNFALYGDSTDFQNWVEVYLNGVRVNFNDTTYGWAITSPSGSLGSIARPITNAVLTFNSAQTGTVQIVGARRPRRAAQFSENSGVSARDMNQVLTDIVATQRETWDKTNDVTGRAVLAAPGETLALLPSAASRANTGACFDNSGNLTSCISVPSGSFTPGSGISFTGTNPTTIAADIAAGGGINFSGSHPLTISNAYKVKFASQYGMADWCANLVAAIADLGSVPGKIIVDGNQTTNACSGAGNISLGNDHLLYFVGGGVFTLNRTIQFGNYGSGIVGAGGGGNGGNPPITTGNVLKWTGATGTPMLYMFGSSFSQFRNIGLDCNGVANCIGIWVNSNNVPISTRNVMEHFEISGAHVGIIIGSASTSAVSGAACNSNVNQDGCSENDVFTIRQFQIFGQCGDTTAEGVRINSLNAAQLSTLGPGNIQCANVGVNVINMNDNFTITGLTLGSVSGTNPTLIQIGAGVLNGPDIVSCESEAGSFAVVDNATGGTQNWSGNQFNQPSIIQGSVITVSTGNIYSTLTVSGNAAVTSIGDVIVGGPPTLGGSGRFITAGNILPAPVAALPACVPGRRGQSQYVTDANATTFNSVVAGGGSNILRVGCDGTNWRIGN